MKFCPYRNRPWAVKVVMVAEVIDVVWKNKQAGVEAAKGVTREVELQ